ncbi:unnamed protein product [Lymnaea stagnalis]|uniref:Uncharacterized protein n=1 Tax=Lymnaea stagnalis TaxID=6523 RepID=A0AAV2HW61_LYMST
MYRLRSALSILPLITLIAAACPPGQWGGDCTQDCPLQCLNVSCDSATGICLDGCNAGYVGASCDKDIDSKRSPSHPIPAAVATPIIIALIITLLIIADVTYWRRRRRNERKAGDKASLEAKGY